LPGYVRRVVAVECGKWFLFFERIFGGGGGGGGGRKKAFVTGS